MGAVGEPALRMLSPRVGPLRPTAGAPGPRPAPADVALRASVGAAGAVGDVFGGAGGGGAPPTFAARMRSRASAGTLMVVLARWRMGFGSSPPTGSAQGNDNQPSQLA